MKQDPFTLQLIDNWQRDFPLTPRPFKRIADEMGIKENKVLVQLKQMKAQGLLSRVGAVVRPNTAAVSTLAALKVPPENLETVAQLVSSDPCVNHNYLREDEWNLWFVASAPNHKSLNTLLQRLSQISQCPLLDLPLVKSHHIDLGFNLGKNHCPNRSRQRPVTIKTTSHDRDLLAALQDGLQLLPRPFEMIATCLGQTQNEVIERISHLLHGGIISRFGLVVRHACLGYNANAMVVWDAPAEHVDFLGEQFAKEDFVTLCYQRRPTRPHWPYNLYCMVHGQERETVLQQIEQLRHLAGHRYRDHKILFSTRCFKQRGARFSQQLNSAREAVHV